MSKALSKSKSLDTSIFADNVNSVDILNYIRANASSEYKNRIPIATQNNIRDIGNALQDYTPSRNEFIDALVNRIGLVIIQNKSWRNPLAEFKKGIVAYGDTVEHLFVDLIKAKPYRVEPPRNDLGDVFEPNHPEILAYFHKINRQDFYEVTINDDLLRRAFTSYNQLDDLITKIFEAVYTSDYYDEFLLMKHLFADYIENDRMYSITVDEVDTEATAKALLTMLRNYSTLLTFLSNQYNPAGVHNFLSREDQVLFIRADVSAYIDVNALAGAFQLPYANFQQRVVILDDFGTEEDDGTLAILTGRDFFAVWDIIYEMRSIENPRYLYRNYFLHHHQILSVNEYEPAIRFTTNTSVSNVTAVKITPENATELAKNTAKVYHARVTGVNRFDDSVVWTVTGDEAVDEKTTVTARGRLKVGINEPNTKLTLTATSVQDSTKSDSIVINVLPAIINTRVESAESTTSVITVDPTIVDFGQATVGTSATRTVAVSVANPEGDLTYTVAPENEQLTYTKAPGWDDQKGGTININLNPTTAGEINQTITASAPNATDVEIKVVGTIGEA